MRRIDRQSAFRQDLKREKLSGRYKSFDKIIVDILTLLASDEPLPERYSDHPLTGNWSGFRECPIKTRFAADLRKARRSNASISEAWFA